MTRPASGCDPADYPFVDLAFQRLPPEEALARSRAFLAAMETRRTVRHFTPDPVPFELIANAIATANTAPSGAHFQPWRFVVVGDPALKHQTCCCRWAIPRRAAACPTWRASRWTRC
jgi:hypothetical protein